MSRLLAKRLSARDWMRQTGEYATELHANVGTEVYNSILATMDEFGEAVLEAVEEPEQAT